MATKQDVLDVQKLVEQATGMCSQLIILRGLQSQQAVSYCSRGRAQGGQSKHDGQVPLLCYWIHRGRMQAVVCGS